MNPVHAGLIKTEHKLDREEALSHKILDLVRDTLVMKMPYLNRALLVMPEYYYIPEDFSGFLDGNSNPAIPAGMGTNGEMIFLNPDWVIDSYRKEPPLVMRTYLHMILHCIYHHPFHYESLDTGVWDMAGDAAVESKILEIGIQDLALEGDDRRKNALSALKDAAGTLTAERIYHALMGDESLLDEWRSNERLFHFDLHEFWMKRGRTGNGEADQDGRMIAANPDTENAWKKIGGHVKMNIEAEEENMGLTPNSISSVICDIKKEREDYSEFLRSFARVREEMHINQDEFDYIYYMYGMKMYGNMPLIEPLEYREAPKISDFVIAVDTSGSCQGNVIRAFLSLTYSILKNSDTFTDVMNLHIIQCDCEIERDVKITTDDEFERYMREIEIVGSGGTDFRPVFQYVDDLIKKNEFSDLRGLLYLTDGLGMFPDKAPNYKTAFVLNVHSDIPAPDTPAWAMRYLYMDGHLMKDDEDDTERN